MNFLVANVVNMSNYTNDDTIINKQKKKKCGETNIVKKLANALINRDNAVAAISASNQLIVYFKHYKHN